MSTTTTETAPAVDRAGRRAWLGLAGFVHFKRQRLSIGSGVSWRSTVA
jgi:hypothetical protein